MDMELPPFSKLSTSMPSLPVWLLFSTPFFYILRLIFLKLIVPVCVQNLYIYCLGDKVKVPGHLNVSRPSAL